MWLLCLTEAEQRAKADPDAGVRARSQETVDLICQRMAMEGITRSDLEGWAKEEALT
jgi:hypothetical protein